MRLGQKISLETKEKMRNVAFSDGRRPPSNQGKHFTQEHCQKISNALRAIKPTHPKRFGLNSPNWKGGKTKETMRLRMSNEYKLWRVAVFKRDNYTCIWCGYRGNKLEADHIKPFAYYPELRFAIDNGRTLCKECHKTTDTYARKRRII